MLRFGESISDGIDWDNSENLPESEVIRFGESLGDGSNGECLEDLSETVNMKYY